MRDHATMTDAEVLARRIEAVMQEIEQAKQERADAAARVARARLAAVQTIKRMRKSAVESPKLRIFTDVSARDPEEQP